MNLLLLHYLLNRSRKPCDEPCDCCTDASSDESEYGDTGDSQRARGNQRNAPAQSSAQQTKAGPSTSGPAQVPPETEDKYDVLGKYVAAKVRQLGKEQRMYVERIIHETIFEGQMGKLNINSQLVVNTETFVSGPSDYAKKIELETNSAKNDAPGIKIEIDMEEPEDGSSDYEDELEPESHGLGAAFPDSVTDTGIEAKRRRLEEPDASSELHLVDVPGIKLEIITEEHDNLEEDLETDDLTTNVLSTTNIGRTNPRKRKLSNETEEGASHSMEEPIDIKQEIDVEENWHQCDVADTDK